MSKPIEEMNELDALRQLVSQGGTGGSSGLTDTQLRATPVPVSGARGTLTDRSGTITAGGTSQQIMAANSSRNYLIIQNVSDTDMWINFGTAAVANQPSIKLSAGGSYESPASFVSTQAVHVFGATTGKAFTAKEG